MQHIWNNKEFLYVQELDETGKIVSVCRIDITDENAVAALVKALYEIGLEFK